MSDTITLTEGQQSAYEVFAKFIFEPGPGVFVLKGYSGTGKSTLVETLLDRLPKLIKTQQLTDPDSPPEFTQVELTATTNQAADQFSRITGEDVSTIHSKLGLRVHKDWKTGKTNLVPRRGADPVEGVILFIDEASYIDRELLKWIFKIAVNCKIVFIGDPAQLLAVGSARSPVFDAGFPTAELTEVVRQAEGNPIIDLSTNFRHTVNTGEWLPCKVDGHFIQHMDRDSFEGAILREFDDPTWSHNRSKVLAWTNKCVINYNQAIRNHVKGEPSLNVGDFAVCNRFLSLGGNKNIKTDQLVRVTGITSPETRHGVIGRCYQLDNRYQVFMPDSWHDAKARLKQARANEESSIALEIDERWADLRAAYACTINKSQGSTFDKVFIDLDDIKRCNSGDQIARMMYVAVSRAREHVYLTGDLA